MCDRISFQPVPKPEVKTAEQLYKEWWLKEKEKDDAGKKED
jgi:hypothetical protein